MPVAKRNFTATEIKAGAFVLAALLTLVAFVAVIRGCGLGGAEVKRFTADFTSINGLNLGAEVRFGGVKVGKVVKITPDPKDHSRILVAFEVAGDVPVNHESVATIEQISLTASMHLELSTGSADAPLHVSGDHVSSRTQSASLVDLPDMEGVMTRLETVLDGIITLLGVERARTETASGGAEVVDLAAVAAALERALEAGTATAQSVGDTVAENRQGFHELVARLNDLGEAADELLANLNAAVDENRGPLRATTGNLQQVSEDAARHLDELAESLRVTLEHLQEASAGASDLLDGQRPTLEQILVNLEAITRNLRQLSSRLAEQPGALIRGSRPQGRKNGEGS